MAELNEVLNPNADEISNLEQLYDIQARNAPSNVYLPYAHNIYDIDLNSRTIYGPSVLSVQRDHKSEIIYFKVDRYYDFMDLANTICIIQYIIPGDASRIPHIYIVPFYDTYKFMKENKIIFPWNVTGAATAKEGNIEYSIRFYKIDYVNDKLELIYNLNTLPATSRVLRSIGVDEEAMKTEYDIPLGAYEELIHQLQNNRTFWTIL